jgi:hypothetical protein
MGGQWHWACCSPCNSARQPWNCTDVPHLTQGMRTALLLARAHARTQKKKGEDVTAFPECAVFGRRIAEGLRSVHVVASSSLLGNAAAADMDAVVALFRAAMNYRHEVFTPSQKAELESWVRGSRVLKVRPPRAVGGGGRHCDRMLRNTVAVVS